MEDELYIDKDPWLGMNRANRMAPNEEWLEDYEPQRWYLDKRWRISLLLVAFCLFAFGLIVMPGLVMRFTTPPLGAGHYVKRLTLTPGEELLAQYGPDFFPHNTFTNLKGDSSVACANDCSERDWFIGVQSSMLYHGLQAVAAGKPVRKATREDVLQGAGK